MRLSSFITSNIDAILREWVAFARRQLPAADRLSIAGLRDDGEHILNEIVRNMGQPQNEAERRVKSHGEIGGKPSTPARAHAMQRERQGFEIEQMVAEYRALRATVLRLWSASSSEVQMQDLEDVTRFNEAVDQAIAESLKVFVAEVDKARDLFLGVLGHDLRGPLGTIASCAQYALRVRPESAREATIIKRSVAQMKALIDDLLEYTRTRLGGGLAIAPSPLELDQFVRDTLDEIDRINPGRALELRVSGDMHGIWDARRLHQALSNLVFNALKYGAPGTPVDVILDGTRDDQVVLGVVNPGPAILAHLLPLIFEPLVRATVESPASQVAGANLGLGLYVVREIAKAHGGTVTVTSSDSAGTRFELVLPRVCTARS